MPPRRSPVALSEAVTRDLRHRLRLAGVLGGGSTISVWLLTGYYTLDRPATIGDAVVGGSAFFVVALASFAVPTLATRERRAQEAVYSTARESARRWRAAFGDSRIPATPDQAIAWLARHPDDTDDTRGARVFVKLVIGDLEEAHRLLARMPAATARERHAREAAAVMARLVEGTDTDLSTLRRLGAELESEDERFRADIDAGVLEGVLAAADGEDWRPALLAVRARLGSRARGALRMMWLAIVGFLAAAGSVLGLAALALRGVLG